MYVVRKCSVHYSASAAAVCMQDVRKAAESFQGRQDKSWTGITVPMYVVSLTPTSLPLACAQAVSS